MYKCGVLSLKFTRWNITFGAKDVETVAYTAEKIGPEE